MPQRTFCSRPGSVTALADWALWSVLDHREKGCRHDALAAFIPNVHPDLYGIRAQWRSRDHSGEGTLRLSANRFQVGEVMSRIIADVITIVDVEEEPWHVPSQPGSAEGAGLQPCGVRLIRASKPGSARSAQIVGY
jgi:hypothetical protein